ncbi:carnosine synthase 1-like isoform X2 [Liolophura sinensis]
MTDSLKRKKHWSPVLPSPVIREHLAIQERALSYTSATGSYCSWSTEVNLGPPASSTKNIPAEDRHIRQYYEALQYTLYETGYPETVDRTANPRTEYTSRDPAIVILSSPVECMCFLLEGGRQCPGDMILVMSTTWLSKAPSDDRCGHSDSHTLYVHKGITSDRAGNTFIDCFDPPRRVTYFMDFFTNACTSRQRCDGEEVERHLECPMSSSVQLSAIVDDKLLTRILAGQAGVPYPKTLAFPYKSSLTYDTALSGITVFPLSTTAGVVNIISAAITKFLKSEEIEVYAKMVVKPSGPMWFGSQNVSVHSKGNHESIIGAAVEILPFLSEGDAILVETFCEPVQRVRPMKISSVKNKATRPPSQLSFRLRANVCRNPDDEAVMTSITCGVGNACQPINGDNTVVQSLEETLKTWGISDSRERQSVYDDIKHKSEATLNAIMKFEENLPSCMKGTVGAQTDLIGIDYVLTRDSGMLSAVLVEVNSHDCTINNQIFEFVNPASSGEAVRLLVRTMLTRSLRYIMRGKIVLVIGAGGVSKHFVWEAANEYGIQVYLIDTDVNHFAARLVKEFIRMDISDHTHDGKHASAIVDLIQGRQLTIDGCVTFWEDCVPLTAMICEKLSLTGAGVQGAINAKTKSLTQKVLSGRNADIPHWPRTHLYASKTSRIESHMDIENAVNIIGFPAVMKLEYGSSAVAVELVENVDQCHDHLDKVQRDLQTESDLPGIGLGHGNAMLLMEYVDGTEHDVDIIIYRRKLVAAFVSDNGPTNLPNFTETSAAMPTYLSPGKRNQLVVAAYQCCTEIGLENGTFNVEMKMTPAGPKLLEINGRMGGFYLRDWIKTCYKVDILLCSFAIACDVRPIGTTQDPTTHILGLMLTPGHHAQALTPEKLAFLRTLDTNGVIRFNQLEESPEPEDYDVPFCNIAVLASDRDHAKTRLIDIGKLIGIDSQTVPMSYWFEDFCSDS